VTGLLGGDGSQPPSGIGALTSALLGTRGGAR
jgi:hypothetical protein